MIDILFLIANFLGVMWNLYFGMRANDNKEYVWEWVHYCCFLLNTSVVFIILMKLAC